MIFNQSIAPVAYRVPDRDSRCLGGRFGVGYRGNSEGIEGG